MGRTYKSEKETIKDNGTLLHEAANSLNGIKSYESIRKYFYLCKKDRKECPTYNVVSEMYDLYRDATFTFPLSEFVDVKIDNKKSLTSINEINVINRLSAVACIIRTLKASSYDIFYFNGLNDVLRRIILDGKTNPNLTNEHYFSMNVATIVTIFGILVTWLIMHMILGAFITTFFLIAENICSIIVLYHTIKYGEKFI